MTPEQELDLRMAEPLEVESVVHLRIAFPDSPKTYNYAGIKVGRQWFFTGADNEGRSWDRLVDWLKSKQATVVAIQRATEWETL